MIWRRRGRPDITEDKPLLGPIVYLPLIIVLGGALLLVAVLFVS